MHPWTTQSRQAAGALFRHSHLLGAGAPRALSAKAEEDAVKLEDAAKDGDTRKVKAALFGAGTGVTASVGRHQCRPHEAIANDMVRHGAR